MRYHSDFSFFPSFHMLALGLSFKPGLPPECDFTDGYHSKPNLYEPCLSSFVGTLKSPPIISCEFNCI